MKGEKEKESSTSEALYLFQSNSRTVPVVNVFISCPLVLKIKKY
jgi:hypothetical protein